MKTIIAYLTREVWPEHDEFGAANIGPEEEFMALREIFYADISRKFFLYVFLCTMQKLKNLKQVYRCKDQKNITKISPNFPKYNFLVVMKM